MSDPQEILLTALYVPGDRPDRFAKATASGADLVVLDLEDSVHPANKDLARAAVLQWLSTVPRSRVAVRVNQLDGPWGVLDLQAMAEFDDLHSIRLPKVESQAQVRQVFEVTGIRVSCLIESAIGVERAFEIASATGVAAIALGEGDLRSDLGVTAVDGLSWVRSRLVVAAAAAELPPPAMSVYTDIADDAGLLASCRDGRGHGFVGRSAVHPRQLPLIIEGFRPTIAERTDAQRLIDGLEQAISSGSGVTLLPDGRLADRALLASSQRTLAIEAAVQMHLPATSGHGGSSVKGAERI